MESLKIQIRPDLCLILSVLLLRIPAVWILSWLVAVIVHEFFHYLALRMLRVDVYRVSFGITGAQMDTASMTAFEELICAAAGPFGGLLLLLLSEHFPVVAVCALVQSLFNLLPLYPLDGGRILFCLLQSVCKMGICENIMMCFRWSVLLLLGVFVVVICPSKNIMIPCFVGLFLLWFRTEGKITCKRGKQIVE